MDLAHQMLTYLSRNYATQESCAQKLGTNVA